MAEPTWKIIYADGAQRESLEFDSPDDVPAYGVYSIVQRLADDTSEVIIGWDWYYHLTEANRWFGGDKYGVLERLRERQAFTGFCQGRWVTREESFDLMGLAKNDAQFPNLIG